MERLRRRNEQLKSPSCTHTKRALDMVGKAHRALGAALPRAADCDLKHKPVIKESLEDAPRR